MTKPHHRVAIIGAGFIVSRGHVPSFQAIENVTVEAVCDLNEARAQAVAAEFGVPGVYSDWQKMIDEVQPSITVIATPNKFHYEMGMYALNAGSHLLCEKPLALTIEHAEEMLNTAAQKNLVLNVGTHFRWMEPTQIAKRHVDGGFFGDIYAARTVYQRRAGIPGYGSWFTNKELSGGGALLDIGIHALDRALYLMGYPNPVTVTGTTFSKLGPRGIGLGFWGSDHYDPEKSRFDVDDFAWAFIRFDSGASLILQVSWAQHFPEGFYTEIYGTEGGAYVSNKDGVDLYAIMNGERVTVQNELPSKPVNSHNRLIENFVRHLDGDPDAVIITPHESLTVVKIVDAIQRSAASGREVAFD